VPAIALVSLLLTVMTEIEGHITERVADFCQYGFSAARFPTSALAWVLRVDLGWYTAFWLLAVAGAAASSVAIEREEDTWVSLTSTPLSGWQILRAKAFGAMWNQRGFAAVLTLIWLIAALTGALRPLGVLYSILLVALLTCLVASIGIYFSLHSGNTSRAIATTILAFCLINGYPVILFLWFQSGVHWDASFNVLGFMPRLAAAPLAARSVDDHSGFYTNGRHWIYYNPLAAIPNGQLWLTICYLVATSVLVWRIVAKFDHWLDRPKVSARER
jgi:hypothetical protein